MINKLCSEFYSEKDIDIAKEVIYNILDTVDISVERKFRKHNRKSLNKG